MTRLKAYDGHKPAYSPDGRGVWVEDDAGCGWADARHLPADMPEEDRALVAASLAPASATTPPDAPVAAAPAESGPTPPLCMDLAVSPAPAASSPHPPATAPVTGPELAKELAAALVGKDKGGRPAKAPPSPEAEAANLALLEAKALLERTKAATLAAESEARIRRERELHELRLEQERERRALAAAPASSPDDLARAAREAQLRNQIAQANLAATVAATTQEDYLVQREEEVAAITTIPPPSIGTTVAMGCSGWVFGGAAGWAALVAVGEAHYHLGLALFLLLPVVGAIALILAAQLNYRQARKARERTRREEEGRREREERRRVYLAERERREGLAPGTLVGPGPAPGAATRPRVLTRGGTVIA